MPDFTVDGDHFVLDGQRVRLLSGAVHYFRSLPAQWPGILAKLKALGCNCVETYVAWNMHETQPGVFDFKGRNNLAAFIRHAADLGLHVIVRPGPYICTEWELGGFPAWLLRDGDMKLRCAHPSYLQAVDRYLDALVPHLAPLQVQNGGPIIAVQVENEYGSFGSDKVYLEHVRAGLRSRGIKCLLFTSDGPSDPMLTHGTIPGVLMTANFGSNPKEGFGILKKFQPSGPLMCTEFWNGWFDHWGEVHHVRNPEDAAKTLDEMLAMGASVNFYMFHGGTNFGFMNGANTENETFKFQPTVTSYDYDSPLSECGDVTPKYLAFRDVIKKYVDIKDSVPENTPKLALGAVTLTSAAALFPSIDRLSKPVHSAAPLCMELVGQNYGFILYRTKFSHPVGKTNLNFEEVRDRAQVFLDGKEIGLMERDGPKKMEIEVTAQTHTLDILVENMGRVNYGPKIFDRKGLVGNVRLGYTQLHGWDMYPLLFDNLTTLEYWNAAQLPAGPAFYRGTFKVPEKGKDTFLALPGWKKGVAWVNGFNLGRYWERGPQKTLYVPWPLLAEGDNEVVVLELHAPHSTMQVSFVDAPGLG